MTGRDADLVALAEDAGPERLDREAPRLRAAFDAAVERGDRPLALRLLHPLAWHLYLRGHHREGRRAAARALAVPGAGGDAARATAWETGFAILTGDGGLDAVPPEGADARALWFLAHCRLHAGDLPSARELVERAVAASREAGDRWAEAAALTGRTALAAFGGGLDEGVRDGERALESFTALGDSWGRRYAGDRLARLAEIGGDYARAAALYRDGLRTAEESGVWADAGYGLAGLGRVALLTGEPAQARAHHERALALLDTAADGGEAGTLARVGLAQLARRTGDLDGAEAHLRAVLPGHERLAAGHGRPFHGLTLVLAELGFVAEERGDAALARSLHERGLAAARELGDPRAEALAHEGLAGAAALDGDRMTAWTHLTQAIRLRGPQTPLPPAERRDVERTVTTLTRRPARPPVS